LTAAALSARVTVREVLSMDQTMLGIVLVILAFVGWPLLPAILTGNWIFWEIIQAVWVALVFVGFWLLMLYAHMVSPSVSRRDRR